MIDPRDLISAATPCPVCNGEGRVYRITPAYEAISQQAGATFGWTGPTHEWRTCHPCRGAGLLHLPTLLDVADALERLLAGENDTDMCPNCVTPWKCNGPHLAPREQARRALARLQENRDD